MPPRRIQYILTHVFKISMSLGAGTAVVIVAIIVGELSLWTLLAMLLALPLGCYLGALFIGPVLTSLNSELNGAPFQEGELVRLLVAPYRDRVTRIYEIWQERYQVRVDLGEKAKENVTDVFGEHEICRESEIT